MVKLLILLSLLSWSNLVFAVDCSKHPIYCAIKTLKPDIELIFGMQISNIIAKQSRKYGLDAYRIVAIIFQESGFRQINRTVVGALHTEVGLERVEIITDFSLFQIHVDTATVYNCNWVQLDSDLDYAASCFFKIYLDKINKCKDLQEPWGCYHSRTDRYFKKYVQLVNKWYNKIIVDKSN